MLSSAPIDTQIQYLMEGLQQHCPPNIRVDHMTVERNVLERKRRLVITVTREGNPRPITFFAFTNHDKPDEHWFPFREVLSKIGLLT